MAGIQAVHDNTPERRIGTSLQATPAATAEASADSVPFVVSPSTSSGQARRTTNG